MKSKFYLMPLMLGILLVCLASFVSADTLVNSCKLNVTLINQDPYPAVPGEYVTLVFQVGGVQDPSCNGARFELIPSYPFSVDGNDTVRILSGGTYTTSNKNDWMIPFKLRVDKDALDENATVEVHYNPGNTDTFIVQQFDVKVQDSRTDFDTVIQDVSGSDVSIAIANTGKYTANSVIVRIPVQDSFMVSGTDGQMVGNLASGDYSVVGFTIYPKLVMIDSRNNSAPRNHLPATDNLKFDIYYTDNIGERRIVNMELPLNLQSNMTGNFSSFQRNGNLTGRNRTSASWSNVYTILIIIAAAIAIFFLFKKYSKKKSKKELKLHDGRIPEWVKNSKDKDKNR